MSTATATVVAVSQEFKVNQGVKPMSLEGLSEKLLDQHWKLYEGYVSNVNALNNSVADAVRMGLEANKPNIAELQRRLGFETNGMVLHEYYFGGMKKGVKRPNASSPLMSALASAYGTFERWEKHFMEAGKMRGVGWVITYFDPLTRHAQNDWVSDHEVGNIAGFIPLIVMDCWEHAYALDFGVTASGRGDYVQVFFRNINWEVLEERFAAAVQGRLLSRIKA